MFPRGAPRAPSRMLGKEFPLYQKHSRIPRGTSFSRFRFHNEFPKSKLRESIGYCSGLRNKNTPNTGNGISLLLSSRPGPKKNNNKGKTTTTDNNKHQQHTTETINNAKNQRLRDKRQPIMTAVAAAPQQRQRTNN